MSMPDLANDPLLAAYLEALGKIAATQNFSQDRRADTRNLSIIFAAIALLLVVLRFFARIKQAANIGWDDWLIVLSLGLLGGNLACNLELVNNGLGLHSGALTLEKAENLGKILLVNEPLYVTNLDVTKLSLLLMYYRIFPVRSMKIGCLILGAICVAFNITLVILAEAQCTPFKKAWAPWVAGHCIDLKVTQLAISIPNILTDIGILCLPMPLIWRLQTNLVQKISLSIVFLSGSFVVFSSIYRFTVFLNYDPNDIPYSLALGCAWNIIEISSGIVSACLPALGPLLRVVFSRLGSSLGQTKPSISQKTRSHNILTIGGTGGRSKDSRSRSSGQFEELKPQGEGGYPDFVPESSTTVSVQAGPRNDTARDRSHGSMDEIPLKDMGIMQQRDMEWREEWVSDEEREHSISRTNGL